MLEKIDEALYLIKKNKNNLAIFYILPGLLMFFIFKITGTSPNDDVFNTILDFIFFVIFWPFVFITGIQVLWM